MSVPRLAALEPWTRAWAGPLALSVAVHAALAAFVFGLGGLFEPPKPEAAIPVELVFASAPTATRAARSPAVAEAKPISDHPESAKSSSSFPRKRESSDPGSPLSRGRRDNSCNDTGGSCSKPGEPPKQDVAATAKPSAPVSVSLPDRAPLPPVRISARASQPEPLTDAQRRAADDAVARMLDDAAAKAATPPPITNAFVSPPTVSPGSSPGQALPRKGGANPRHEPFISSPSPSVGEDRGEGEKTPSRPATQQAARAGAADGLVPPAWGRPGLGNARPVYPRVERIRGIEGRVVLRVRVDAAGHVEAVAILHSSGHEPFDEAARRAVSAWRFVPGRLAGIPVAASVDVPVVFRLKD